MTKKERLHTYATALAIVISVLHPQLESCRLEAKQDLVETQADSGYKVLVMAVERLGKEMDRLHARLDRIAEPEEESRLASKNGGGPGTTSAVASDKWMGPTETTVMPDEPPPPPPPKAVKRRVPLPRTIQKAQQALQSGDITLD